MAGLFTLLKPFWGLGKFALKGAYSGATAGPMGRTLFGAGVGAVAGFATSDYESPTLRADDAIRGAFWGGALGFGTAVGPKLLKTGWKGNLAIGKRIYDRSLIGPRLPSGEFFSKGPKDLSKKLIGPRDQYGAFYSAKGLERISWKAGLGASPGVSFIKGTAGTTGSAAFNVGRFAFEHPLVTAGVVGGIGAGMYAAGEPFRSPTMRGTEIDINYNRQAIAAQELQMSGISPMGMVGTAPQMMGPMNRAMMRSTEGLVQGIHRGRHG
jgi:hypothetical protein